MNFESVEPSKNSYGFKEIASITGVKPYVLRFWENEFEEISPAIASDGAKSYSSDDLSSIKKIKDLLFEKKLSIDEAKLILKGGDMESLRVSKLPAKKVGEVKVAGSSISILEEGSKSKNELDFQKEELDYSLKLKTGVGSEASGDLEIQKELVKLKNQIEKIILDRAWD